MCTSPNDQLFIPSEHLTSRSRTVVASFFERSLEKIKEGIDLASRRSDHKAKARSHLVAEIKNADHVSRKSFL
jgi:hypothetical protein